MVALTFFLVVVAVIFSLFTVSYFIRMELPDWTRRAVPAQLWFNTGLLIISSVMFQWTRTLLKRGETRNLKTSLLGGGVFAIAFIGAQLMVWSGLRADGITMTSNPADSFFYLLTGLHGLHMLGGLWVWSKSSIKLMSGSAEPKDIKLSVELCTIYWHALLVVWLVLFGILANT
jgi:cytochrome c oxidase subunit 3